MSTSDNMQELARAVARQAGLSEQQALASIRSFLDEVIDTLVRDRRIQLDHFGVFELKLRKSRWCRNPGTGESIHVPDKYHARFRPSKSVERFLANLSRHEEAENGSGGEPEESKRVRRWWHFWR